MILEVVGKITFDMGYYIGYNTLNNIQEKKHDTKYTI